MSKREKPDTSKAVRTNGKSNNGIPPENSDARTMLESRFDKAQTNLSASRRRLLSQILAEADETFFLSSRELGRRYNVDSATIVRTVQALGYKKFADFAHDLRNHFVTQITPYTALRAATQKKRSVADYVSQSLEQDVKNITSLKSQIDTNKIVELAKQINKTRRIIVVGIDFAASLAISLAYGLVRVGRDAEAPTGSSGSIQNKINVLTEKDMLIAISFGKCLRETVEAAQQARRRNIPTFGITDSDRSPIGLICDQHVTASTERASFIDSYVAPTAVTNAILVACAHSQPKRALKMLEQFDKESASARRWYENNGASNG
jgi:DNA-binding MurR/RpiR family transcriptional regulator